MRTTVSGLAAASSRTFDTHPGHGSVLARVAGASSSEHRRKARALHGGRHSPPNAMGPLSFPPTVGDQHPEEKNGMQIVTRGGIGPRWVVIDQISGFAAPPYLRRLERLALFVLRGKFG